MEKYNCFGGTDHIYPIEREASWHRNGIVTEWAKYGYGPTREHGGLVTVCYHCEVYNECFDATYEMLRNCGKEILTAEGTVYAQLSIHRNKRHNDYYLNRLNTRRKLIMNKNGLKLPEKWFDNPSNFAVDDAKLAEIKTIRAEIVEQEKKLALLKRKVRLASESTISIAEVVTKKNGLFRCAFTVSIDDGVVAPDLEAVQVFNEDSGESQLNNLEAALSEEILSLLKKELKL
jgi:hypothetical protein